MRNSLSKLINKRKKFQTRICSRSKLQVIKISDGDVRDCIWWCFRLCSAVTPFQLYWTKASYYFTVCRHSIPRIPLHDGNSTLHVSTANQFTRAIQVCSLPFLKPNGTRRTCSRYSSSLASEGYHCCSRLAKGTEVQGIDINSNRIKSV